MDERLRIEPDPNVQLASLDPLDVVEPEYDTELYPPPSVGSRRCMIYRKPSPSEE